MAPLGLFALQLINAEIAERLALSESTAPNVVSSILAKPQVNERSRAIRLARAAGFGTGR